MAARVDTVVVGALSTNCYLWKNLETNECLVIDPGGDAEKIIVALGGFTPRAVLLTHGHYDHIAACDALCGRFDIPLYIHELDVPLLTDPHLNVSLLFREEAVTMRTKPSTVREGDKLTLAGLAFTVLHTPGHTPGGTCYLACDHSALFCGDTLFAGGYGHTDFPGGDFSQLRQSLRRLLMELPRTPAYPGHGESTYAGRCEREADR